MEGENGKILEALQTLSPLLQRENEWGGRVNLRGEIEELREGEENTHSINPREERAKRAEGWRGFHVHPADKNPLPSVQDFLATHLCGAPEYVITTRGIWEIRPVRVLPLDEVVQFLKSSAVLLQVGTLEAYRAWEDKVRQVLPVEVSLFEWPEESAEESE